MTASRLTALLAAVAVSVVTLEAPAIHAEPSAPLPHHIRESPLPADVENEYNRGIQARLAKNWPAAIVAFQAAVTVRPAFPEAWNELGYAFRHQGRYAESLHAYDEALRLRVRGDQARR